MIRNLGGQTVSAELIDKNTGGPFAGTVIVYITGDNGTQVAGSVGLGVATLKGNGTYTYAPSQGETNFSHVAYTFIGTDAIDVSVSFDPITAAQAAALSSATVTDIGDGPTRQELLAQIAYRLNKTPPPSMDSATQARLVSFINQRQRRILTMPGTQRLRQATVTMASVASQPTYALVNIAKVQRMFETTNQRVLYELSQQDYRLLQPDTSITGVPEAYIWTGRQVVVTQPSNASAIYVKSSSALDTTATVYVEGIITGGYPQTAAVALTGTTAVAISTVTTWTRIDKFYLSATCVGSITLSEDSGSGTTLSVIPAGQTNPSYTGLALWPTPASAVTYYVDVTRTVTDLTHDNDVAAIPDDFADLLVLGAVADEYQHLSDKRWSAAMAEYDQRVKQLKYWLAETSIGRPVALSLDWQPPSRLGSMYPAGS